MRIDLNLSSKSIGVAIERLKKAKIQLETVMIDEFLADCCTFIREKANEYVMASNVGSIVKANIVNGWQLPVITRVKGVATARLTNTDDKASFVEFGVGIVGQSMPHPNASETNYEYNVPSESKSIDGSWVFFANENELDLPVSALLGHNWFNDVRGEKGKRLFVMTKGTQGVWYAYNACVDLITVGYKTIWETIKKKYWG